MERRKFMIGAGSTAIGLSALVGSGAFTTMNSGRRTTEVRVPDDSKAYVGLAPKSDYAKLNDDGKLELFFNEEQGVIAGDGGLNPGSTYNFESVFEIRAQHTQGDTYFYIEQSGFDVDIELTAGEDTGNKSKGDTLMDSDNLTKLYQPDSVDVDITIDATDKENQNAGGEIIVHAASGGNKDRL